MKLKAKQVLTHKGKVYNAGDIFELIIETAADRLIALGMAEKASGAVTVDDAEVVIDKSAKKKGK